MSYRVRREDVRLERQLADLAEEVRNLRSQLLTIGDDTAGLSTGLIETIITVLELGTDLAVVTTSEAVGAGDFVNLHLSTGAKIRKADASVAGKEAHGFVRAAYGAGVGATLYFEGRNDVVTGATPGVVYLSETVPGGFTSTEPTGSGEVVQRIGVATSATEINFEGGEPVLLA